jgi:hypothetical protein
MARDRGAVVVYYVISEEGDWFGKMALNPASALISGEIALARVSE